MDSSALNRCPDEGDRAVWAQGTFKPGGHWTMQVTLHDVHSRNRPGLMYPVLRCRGPHPHHASGDPQGNV
jgi:hypothetical protein